MATIVAMAVAVVACAGGDIGAPMRPSIGQPAGGALLALTAAAAGPTATLPPGHVILPIPPQPQISYTTGFANAQRLGFSTLLGEPAPAKADLDLTVFQTFELDILPTCSTETADPECTIISYSTGQLSYRGQHELPPATATFLAYGFVPVTATLQLATEPSNCPAPTVADLNHAISAGICLLTIEHGQWPAGQEDTGTAKLAVHLSNLKVDGTSLNVSSHCQAAGADLQVVGSSALNPSAVSPGQFVIALGGTLAGTVTIPPFTGCVTPSGEDLNPLLTSAVSGAGNDVQLTEGNLCSPTDDTCVPTPPAPGRGHGQVLLQTFQTGAASLQEGTIGCVSAKHGTAITGKAGALGSIGAMESLSLSGCTAQMDGASCTAKGIGLPWPINSVYYDPVAGQATGTIGDAGHPFDIDFTCKRTPSAPACSVEESINTQTASGAGSVDIVYDYRSHTLTDFGAALAPVSSNCPGFVADPLAVNTDQDQLYIPPYVVNSSPASRNP
jgi:hypothetical protein